MNIKGKTALVTGASRGIGRAIAIELAKQGASYILLLARNLQKLKEVTTEVRKYGGEGTPLSADLTESAAVNIAFSPSGHRYSHSTFQSRAAFINNV